MQVIAPETLELLMAQRWRGNVRSLRNVIEAALIQINHGVGELKPDHLRDLVACPAPEQARIAVMAVAARPRTTRSVAGNSEDRHVGGVRHARA